MLTDAELTGLAHMREELSRAFGDAQARAGMPCPPDCGRCCRFPGIHVAPLEMLPAALELARAGQAEEILARLEEGPCALLQELPGEGQGRCSLYHARPSVCRAFGVAGGRDKTGAIQASVCGTLKEHHAHAWESLDASELPVLSDWVSMLSTLHPELAAPPRPINLALRAMLEKLWLRERLNSG